MKRREFVLSLPLMIFSSKKILANNGKNALIVSTSSNGYGCRKYTIAENKLLFLSYCKKYDISPDFEGDMSNVVKLHVVDDIDDCDELIRKKIAEAFLKSSFLYLYGGGTLFVSSEIETQVSILGDGKTKIKQKGKNVSLLVLSKANITIKDIIITPSNYVRTIKKAGVEIRGVDNCRILNIIIQYVGENNTEGNGITINQGSQNVINNCKFFGANLKDDVYHYQGGNDISVYGESSKNIIAFNNSVGRNIRGIFQLNDLLGKKCDENIYIANHTDGALGYGHLCYEKRHNEKTSMSGTKFIRGVVKNISGCVKIPNGKYKDKKIFGMGVYNQAGKNTYIEDYLIDNVCSDTELTEVLPLAAIGSTTDSVTIKNNTIINSGASGVKISPYEVLGNNELLIINNDIRNINKDGVVILNCKNVFLSNMSIVNCNYSLKLNNKKPNSSSASLSMIRSNDNKGIYINGFSNVSISNFISINDINFLSAQKINNLSIDNGVVTNSKEVAFYISESCDNIMIDSVSIANSRIGLNIPKWTIVKSVGFKNNSNNFER